MLYCPLRPTKKSWNLPSAFWEKKKCLIRFLEEKNINKLKNSVLKHSKLRIISPKREEKKMHSKLWNIKQKREEKRKKWKQNISDRPTHVLATKEQYNNIFLGLMSILHGVATHQEIRLGFQLSWKSGKSSFLLIRKKSWHSSTISKMSAKSGKQNLLIQIILWLGALS